MPFENERVEILFTIRMALMHCRTSPKAERHEHVRRVQADAVLTQLERCGYRIVQTGEGRGIRPSNIGGDGCSPQGTSAFGSSGRPRQ